MEYDSPKCHKSVTLKRSPVSFMPGTLMYITFHLPIKKSNVFMMDIFCFEWVVLKHPVTYFIEHGAIRT